MAFEVEQRVRLYHTDAAGILFFGSLFSLCQDAIEDFLATYKENTTLLEMPFLFPVVHTESNYYSPLLAGDLLKTQLSIKNIGNSSINFLCTFIKEEKICADALIKVVCVDKKTFTKHPLNTEILKFLDGIEKNSQ